jgi:predicted transcriptional regulator YdeE
MTREIAADPAASGLAATSSGQSVWNHFSSSGDHMRAFTADFELYRGPNAVEIYVAVKSPPTSLDDRLA